MVSEEERPDLVLVRRGTYGGGLIQDSGSPHNDEILDDSAPQSQRWWRTPSPYWIIPVIFFPGWGLLGTMPVFQHLAKDFYGKDAELYYNISMGCKGFIMVIVGPLVGGLSDRFGRKPLMLFQALCTCVPGILIVAFNLFDTESKYAVFLLLQALGGLQGSTFTVLFAYIADTSTPDQRAKVMGIIMGVGLSLAGLGSPIFWSYIDQHFGLHNFVHFYAAFWILQVVVVLLIPESNGREKRASLPPMSLRDLNPFRYFRIMFAVEQQSTLPDGRTVASVIRNIFGVVFCLYVAKMGFLISLGLYAQTNYGFTTMQASFLQTTYNGSVFFSQFFLFAILRVFSQRTTCALGVSAGVVSGIILSLPGIPSFLLYVSEAWLATSFVTFTVSSVLVTKVVPKDKVGEATGLLTTALSLCEGMGPMMFGALMSAFQDTSYPQAGFLIFTVVMTGGVGLACCLPSDDVIAARCVEIKLEADLAATAKKVLLPCADVSTIASTAASSPDGASSSVSDGP